MKLFKTGAIPGSSHTSDDIREVRNHIYLLDYLGMITRVTLIDIELLQHFNNVLLDGTRNSHFEGRWRPTAIVLDGAPVVCPQHYELPALMDCFVEWLQTAKDTLHPAILALEAHLKLVSIHPWVDGNGRTARLLQNLILHIYGYPPAIITAENKMQYINFLQGVQTANDKEERLAARKAFYTFMLQQLEEVLKSYLSRFDG